MAHPDAKHWLTPQPNGGAICTHGRQIGDVVPDVLSAAHPVSNFVGGKPDAWSRWVLDMLGYQSGAVVGDLYPGRRRHPTRRRQDAVRIERNLDKQLPAWPAGAARPATPSGTANTAIAALPAATAPICLLRARLAVTPTTDGLHAPESSAAWLRWRRWGMPRAGCPGWRDGQSPGPLGPASAR